MIIVCQKCSTRLQIDDEKSPQRPFNVRCPKCNNTVSSGPANPAMEQSALAVGGSPATEHPRFEQSTAHAYEPPTTVTATTNGNGASNDDTIRMFMDLLSKNSGHGTENPHARPSWDKRKALLCTGETYRESVAQKLSDCG